MAQRRDITSDTTGAVRINPAMNDVRSGRITILTSRDFSCAVTIRVRFRNRDSTAG